MMATEFIKLELKKHEIEYCLEHGCLMRDGRVGLGNVKYGDIDNAENYTDGKIGEYAFKKWLEGEGVQILHHPFRNDYSLLNPKDDFIIELRGRRVQVETKHKTRNYPPQSGYEQCTDKINPYTLYVFTERHRSGNRPKKKEE